MELDARVPLHRRLSASLATLLFGLVPALHATRVDVAPLLKSDDAGVSGAPAAAGACGRSSGDPVRVVVALLIVAGTFVRTIVDDASRREAAAFMDRITFARPGRAG